MSLEQTLRETLADWLLKTPRDTKPRRISPDDIVSMLLCIRELKGSERAIVSSALVAKYGEWLVQRARGDRPSHFAEQDADKILSFVPETFFTPKSTEPTSEPLSKSIDEPEPEVPPEYAFGLHFSPFITEPVIERIPRKKHPENPVARHDCPPNFLFHLRYGV